MKQYGLDDAMMYWYFNGGLEKSNTSMDRLFRIMCCGVALGYLFSILFCGAWLGLAIISIGASMAIAVVIDRPRRRFLRYMCENGERYLMWFGNRKYDYLRNSGGLSHWEALLAVIECEEVHIPGDCPLCGAK